MTYPYVYIVNADYLYKSILHSIPRD